MQEIKLKLPGEEDFFTQEAYKALRTNVQFCGQDIKVIAITSCTENEGKSTITLSMAKSFAELGKKVLVIDADMRKSVMAVRNSNAKKIKGLSEILTGMIPLSEGMYKVEDCTLQIIFAGQYPPNPVELLEGKYFSSLLNESKKYFDYIFIDTPPLGQVIDAAVVTANCDGAIMVLGNSRVRHREAQGVVEQIKKSGCKVLGVIRNSQKKKDKAYYGKKKKYAYGK